MRLHTFENVQTNSAELINIWVIDLCKESNLWRSHRIVIW